MKQCYFYFQPVAVLKDMTPLDVIMMRIHHVKKLYSYLGEKYNIQIQYSWALVFPAGYNLKHLIEPCSPQMLHTSL